MNNVVLRKWRIALSITLECLKSLKNVSSATITINSECSTQWLVPFFSRLNRCNRFNHYHASVA